MFGIHFKEAFEGLVQVFKKEKNFKIHLVISLIVVIFGFYFGLKFEEWLILILTIAFVLSMETVNTAIEIFIDSISRKRKNKTIELIKDISAAAVLISVLASIVIGILIFIPKIVAIFI